MYRILICDDQTDIVNALKIYLQPEGYELFEAYNGEQAVELCRENQMDLILLDVMMPVMDGIAATKAIRALERHDAKTIPIIAMTANAFEEDARKCLDAGMNAHLAKPLDVQKLIEILARCVRLKDQA